MSRPRKYNLPPPPPTTVPASPAEIIEAPGKIVRATGTPVKLVSAGPPLEIIEARARGPRPDPDQPLVPTETEVASLPRWARMAFASRCARRLLPLLDMETALATPDQRRAVVVVVKAAEQSAAAAALQSRAIATAVREVKTFRSELVGFAGNATTAALAAAHAMGCDAAQAAVAALQRLATVRTLRFVLLPRRDFDHLSRLSKEQNWTDDTPVPPEVFGPMWDRESPPWWRDDFCE